HGCCAIAEAAMPTCTNPDSRPRVTGAAPSVHGISGNLALERETGREVMMSDHAMLRSDTILARISQAGVPVAAITAKDKLRAMLGRGLRIGEGAICFSSEHADRCAEEEHGSADVETMVGRAKPDMYSAD